MVVWLKILLYSVLRVRLILVWVKLSLIFCCLNFLVNCLRLLDVGVLFCVFKLGWVVCDVFGLFGFLWIVWVVWGNVFCNCIVLFIVLYEGWVVGIVCIVLLMWMWVWLGEWVLCVVELG